MIIVQHKNKGDHNRRLHIVPKTIEVGHYVYLDWPLLATSAAEYLAAKCYSELLSFKTGPSQVVEVMPVTMKIDEDGIRNILSVYRATRALTLKEMPTNDNRMQVDYANTERQEAHARDTRMEE